MVSETAFVFGWHPGERREIALDDLVEVVGERLSHVGQPLLRPWRYRHGNSAVWWTRFGRTYTYRITGEQISPRSVAMARPVLQVTVASAIAGGTLVKLRYRAAWPPIFLRCASLGLMGLTISRADDERRWNAVHRSLEQSVGPAITDLYSSTPVTSDG